MSENPLQLCETQVIGHGTEETVVPGAACPTSALYGITALGISRADRDFCWVRRQPSMSVVMVCFGGEGRVLVEGSWRRCGEGMAYITPLRALHAYRAVADVRWDVCWVVYEPPGQLPTVALTAPTLAEVGPSALPGIVRGLYREYLGIGEANAMHLWVELAQLEVSRLTRRWHADNRLSRLWEAVNAALEQPWTVAALAEKAGMSGEHLRALCHKYLSRSPGKQVTYLRMQRASYLLKVTGWTVEKTAQAVGYDNAFAFSTAFKRWSGRSPSEFRAAAESTDGVPP